MKIYVLVILLVFTFSCENDNDHSNIRSDVYAGIINENMFVENFNGDFYLSYTWSQCGYGDCQDSIDLMNDGKYDLLLKARFLNPQMFFSAACCPPPIDCQPIGIIYQINSLNKVKIACKSRPYHNMTLNWADTIPEGYRIDTIKNWQSNALIWSLVYQSEMGPWYYLAGDRYIAFRSGDSTQYKYGWFKVGISNDHNMLFKKYAIEK